MKTLSLNRFTRKIPLLLFLVFLTCECFAQNFLSFATYNVDSLLFILPFQHENERVNSLIRLAKSLSFQDFDLSERYAEEAMNLAKELDYQEGIAAAFRNLGLIRFYQDNYPEALKNGFEALQIYEKLNNKHSIADTYYDIAIVHYYARNYEKAIEYGNIALDKFREHQENGTTVGNVRDTLKVLGGLGLIYDNIGMYDKALDISDIYLEVGKKNNFGITEMMLQTWLAASRFFDMGETDSAKVYYHKALSYHDVNTNIEALKYRAITWLGYLHYSEGEADSAIYYLQKSFKYYNEKGFLLWAMWASMDLGKFYFKKNKMNIAEQYYLQSQGIFNEMLSKNSMYRHDSLKHIVVYGLDLYGPLPPRHMKEFMWGIGTSMYYKLFQINKDKKKSDKALTYHLAYSDAKDTLNKIRRGVETMELQTKYETERKEEQIVSLSQENAFQEFKLKQSGYFLLGLGGIVILVVILGIVLIRQNKLREQQKNLLLQQKLFRSQMNPHFIFNSLTSIQNYILDEEAHQASKYLSRFSKLVRNILDSSIEDYVPLEEEISTIENYLELQKIRFQNKFDYTIEVDEAINPESMHIPPMLAQPFIENSIEHGIKHKKSKGNISIRFSLKDNLIVFEVEDNGVGREKAKEILYKLNKEHKSLATAITRERIRVLNRKLKNKIQLQILDLKNSKNEPSGTRVLIEIPC
nr:histidine kinase [Bacteroidota bacterium]